jgi:hypothetical protein
MQQKNIRQLGRTMDLCEGLVVDIGFCDALNATDTGSNLWVNDLLENLQSGTHCM